MRIEILAFGIARDILGVQKSSIEVDPNTDVGTVRSLLISQFPDFEKLQSLRFAVNEEYVGDSFVLSETDEVVLIPPVSGG